MVGGSAWGRRTPSNLGVCLKGLINRMSAVDTNNDSTLLVRTGRANWLSLLAGYVLAVLVGSLMYIAAFTIPHFYQHQLFGNTGYIMIRTQDAVLRLFPFALILCLPVTAFGLLVFRYVLPKRKATLLLLGALTPIATSMGLTWLTGSFDQAASDMNYREIMELVLACAAAGVSGAYMLGAVGLRLGFGKWRFD